MRLSWNEVRVRAAGFAQEWWNTVRERSETQSFYNEFFEIFGVKRRSVARYEQHVKKLDNHSGFIDLFWPGVLIVEQKSAGRDLSRAYDQAAELVGRLHDALHAAGYQGHDLERFLVRIVFCLFADDTGIFEPRDIFLDFIETRTGEDGSDTGARLMELFQVLDTPETYRLKSRKDSRRLGELQRFQKKLGQMRFFDPACGCGNFLIIAYRELRALEIEVLKEIHQSGQWDALAEDLSVINVDQFYGIELGEFPARIAETALWMMDHIMNNRLSLEFGQIYARIPLMTSPHIVHGDALETDWAELLPPEECSFVFGNPPFVGAKFQTAEQRAQVRGIAALGKTGGTLDYVTAWFIKAGKYVQTGKARIGFVATNSITQGEQVAQLWPILFDRCKLEIGFAHRTFAWRSDARGKAHVHVVIIGLDQQANVRADKRLFSYLDINGEPEETSHAALSPYLFDAGGLANPHLTVCGENRPINGMRQLIIGSKPIDGGHYIFDANDRTALLEAEPDAVSFLRLFVGAQEFLQGGARWILALQDVAPNMLAKLPRIRERIASVRDYRLTSKSGPTVKLAETPTLYHVNVLPTDPFLVIPEVSSERREYVPIGWLEPPTIPSNLFAFLKMPPLHAHGVPDGRLPVCRLVRGQGPGASAGRADAGGRLLHARQALVLPPARKRRQVPRGAGAPRRPGVHR